MDEGKLFYHYLDGEIVRCEREEDSLGDGPRFRLSIVGEDERIELRDLSLADLQSLREQIDGAIRSQVANEQHCETPPDGVTPSASAEPYS